MSDPLRLEIKLDGPLVEAHKLPLSEFRRLTKQLHTALQDVATVLSGYGPSGRTGRVKKFIEQATDLRVVESPRQGSFVLELEVPPPQDGREKLPIQVGPDLGERSVETLVSGLRELTDATETLPAGFDPGVLKALLRFRTSIKRGIVDIAFAITGQDAPNESHLNAEKVDVAARLIERPIRAHGSASGTLEMVDFKSLQCRIDRPPLPSVLCTFDEKERDTVQAAVRQFVHVEGEAEFDPGSTEPSRIWVASIDVLYEALPFDPQSFWQVSRNADLVAHARAPIAGEEEDDGWRDDEEAARLIDAIRQSG